MAISAYLIEEHGSNGLSYLINPTFMIMKLSSERKKGFTLIELLVVITIIGILAGIAIGPMGDILFNTSRTASGEDLGTIYTTIRDKSAGGEIAWPSNDKLNGAAQNIAIFVYKENSNVDKPSMYFLSKDPALELFEDDDGEQIPERITDIEGSLDGVKEAFGYCIAVPSTKTSVRLKSAKSGIYPIMWTRGLESGETEWSEDSPWSGSGGHVLFSNGSVEWYDNTEGKDEKGVFKKYLKSGSKEQDSFTSDISQAIPENWEILDPSE